MTGEQAFPKPRKRLKDPHAIDVYRRSVKRCEGGCNKRPIHVHHIISKKDWRGGDDVPENLLHLDVDCHLLWHNVGAREWLKRRGEALKPDVVAKIRRALRMDGE